MSTSSADPRPSLSVVVASNGAPGSLERCLSALEPQLDGVELVVCAPASASDALRDAHPRAVWHVREGARVPALWRDGIRRSTGAVVALTISPMVVDPDWIAALRRGLEEADVVGGAVEVADGLGAADRAEHLVRYHRDLLPFEPHACLDLPGDNAAYPRALLDAVAGAWESGFVEPGVHRSLVARGARLLHDPRIVVRMGPSAGPSAFVGQRWAHGREHAAIAGATATRAHCLVRIAAAPLVPMVLVGRTLSELRRRRRLGPSTVLLMPLVALFDAAWAAGEAAGYVDALRAR